MDIKNIVANIDIQGIMKTERAKIQESPEIKKLDEEIRYLETAAKAWKGEINPL